MEVRQLYKKDADPNNKDHYVVCPLNGMPVHVCAEKCEEIVLSCGKYLKEKSLSMKKVKINLSETTFNIYWHSLCDREYKLLNIIKIMTKKAMKL